MLLTSLGTCSWLPRAVNDPAIHIADDPITADGRIELLHYLREQTVTRTLHRYGNLV